MKNNNATNDLPIVFADEKWEKLESELQNIKLLLHRVLEKLGDQPSRDEEVIVSARDVAKSLGVDISNVYAKCAKGKIPHFKDGKQYRFRQSDIDAWLGKGEADKDIDVEDYVNKYLQGKVLKG